MGGERGVALAGKEEKKERREKSSKVNGVKAVASGPILQSGMARRQKKT